MIWFSESLNPISENQSFHFKWLFFIIIANIKITPAISEENIALSFVFHILSVMVRGDGERNLGKDEKVKGSKTGLWKCHLW